MKGNTFPPLAGLGVITLFPPSWGNHVTPSPPPTPEWWLDIFSRPPSLALASGVAIVGNPSPSCPGVPPLIFCPYVLFSLYNQYFIGSFEKRDNKNLRKKIKKMLSGPY